MLPRFYLDINDCSSNPCQNGGQCQDGVASFKCKCRTGFQGTRCEISKNFSIT